MNRSASSSELGSLPLVLIASIAIGGVVLALFYVVQSGVTSARNDRNFAGAIQVADAGLQHAFVELQDLEAGETPACDTNGDGACSGSLNDGSAYEFEYEPTAERRWTVTSRGTSGDSVRAVQASVGESPLFGAAIVSDESFKYNGGGSGTDPFPVGGFKKMNFTGNTGDYIETLFLYGTDNEPDGPGAPDTDKWERTPGPDLPNLGAKAFETGGVCEGKSESLPSHLERRIYCLTGTANFQSNTTVAPAAAVDPDPVQIYVQSGGMSVGPRNVNDGGEAVDLQIYIGAGEIVMNGNFRVTAAIYAPKSACTSNGQGGGGFAGGMICNTVTLNGNMRYDPTIEQIVDDEYAISGWSEQPGLARQASATS